jgi:diguanylate cyclase (GGDEF)-like protein
MAVPDEIGGGRSKAPTVALGRGRAEWILMATIRFGAWAAVGIGGLGLLVGRRVSASAALEDLEYLYAFADRASVLRVLRPVHPLVVLGIILANAVLLAYIAYLVRRQIYVYRRTEARLRKQISEITLLQEAISAIHDLRSEDALQSVVEIVTHVMGFQRAALYLGDQVKAMYTRYYSSCRLLSKEAPISPIVIDDELYNVLIKLQNPIVINCAPGAANAPGREGAQIVVPLCGDSGTLGILVADSHDRQASCQSDKEMLARLARSAVVAIENASLHRDMQRMANRDGLTNLYNYRCFQESLRETLKAAGDLSVSLLMIEIDKFKRYNDTYGHRQGDKALCSLAQALQACTAPWKAMVARYGGDEFVVILPQVGQKESIQVARTVHQQVYRQTKAALAEHSLPPVTMSIGVATFPDDVPNADELIEAADRAMYMVKYRGGNRVYAYSESGTT